MARKLNTIEWTYEQDQFIIKKRSGDRNYRWTWSQIADVVGHSRRLTQARGETLMQRIHAAQGRSTEGRVELTHEARERLSCGIDPLPSWHPIARQVLEAARNLEL